MFLCNQNVHNYKAKDRCKCQLYIFSFKNPKTKISLHSSYWLFLDFASSSSFLFDTGKMLPYVIFVSMLYIHYEGCEHF